MADEVAKVLSMNLTEKRFLTGKSVSGQVGLLACCNIS